MRVAALLLLLATALAAAGCGDSDGQDAAAGGATAVVATTTIAGDLVRNVGGERVHVDTLVPAGADPHGHGRATRSPSPRRRSWSSPAGISTSGSAT
jgi:ABC-type Zn uptake system ZnuABC Zn-binding protein ZnuA